MAQTTPVSGVVVDDSGEPIIGASIIVKGTTTGTVTDVDGKFSLNVPTSNKTLVVSYIGMNSKEVSATSNMKITLSSSAIGLDEVMVIAYGTAKKSSFTGSVGTVNAEKLEKRNVATVTKALDGTVAGLKTTSGGGQPGSEASVVIRGYGSINASNNPLYVVDGIPYDGALNAINSNDIESISVLKDASASTLYGNRAANGVVIITTKKGKEGKATVNFKGNWGVSSRAIPRYETVNENEYMELFFQLTKNEAIYKNGVNPDVAGQVALANMLGPSGIGGEQYNPFNYKIAELIDPNTGKVRDDAQLTYHEDWVDEMLRDNPFRQEYQFSVNGSNGKTSYLTSLGYLDENGLLETTSFNRYSGRVNVDTQPKDWFKTGLGAAFSQTSSNFKNYRSDASSTANVWYSSQFMAPIYPVYLHDVNGILVLDGNGDKQYDFGPTRPIQPNWNALATLHDDKTNLTRDNISGRTYLQFGGEDVKSGVLKDFAFITNFGFDYYNQIMLDYYNPYNGNAATSKGRASKENIRRLSYTFNQLLTYKTKINDLHDLDVLVGHEYYDRNNQVLYAEKTNFAFGEFYELAAASTITDATSYTDRYCVESYLSRINYNYDEKYYLSGSFRTDASSRFYADSRWGQFWSLGASWRISKEFFLSDVEKINNLTLKISYGTQGNDGLLNSLGEPDYYPWQATYDLGYPNASNPGAAVTRIENKALTWEKNNNFNVGIEGRFFDRLGVTLEYYNKKTTDLLLQRPKALSTGFTGYWDNVGDMVNNGFEATITGDIIRTNDLTWSATFIGSMLKNKVTRLTKEAKEIIPSQTRIIKEGESIYTFYLAKSAGVDPLTGDQLYWALEKDADGNVTKEYITNDYSKVSSSRQIMGTRIPDFEGSIATELKYKGFDASILTTFSVGGKILDNIYSGLTGAGGVIYNGNTFHKDALRAWKEPGDITDMPKLWWSSTTQITDRFLVNASYFAIRNAVIGYTLPQKTTDKIGMSSVRFFAQGDNLALFTHLKGMDPQFNFSGFSTNYGYITTRVVSLGVDIKF